jgi:hypothetical protein
MTLRKPRHKPMTVPILARVTPDERAAVQALAFAEGCNSMSSWIRQQLVRRLQEAEGKGQGQGERYADGIDQR